MLLLYCTVHDTCMANFGSGSWWQVLAWGISLCNHPPWFELRAPMNAWQYCLQLASIGVCLSVS